VDTNQVAIAMNARDEAIFGRLRLRLCDCFAVRNDKIAPLGQVLLLNFGRFNGILAQLQSLR
jgi:hypothetical protein